MARQILALCFLVILTRNAVEASRLRLNAKLLARAQIESTNDAHYVHAWSASHCLARCNKKVGGNCDAVNYFKPSGRCQLIGRCSQIRVQQNSSDYYFYSKRPLISSPGFRYDSASESCIKVLHVKGDYEMADRECSRQNGRLATLKTPSSNRHARSLLRASRAQFAWIGLLDIGVEGNPTHSDGSKVWDSNFFMPAAQHWKNATHKNCWALRDDGFWGEFSCKKHKFYSICEVPIF